MSDILLIDSEQPFATDLQGALSQRGFSVNQLEDGKEGLAHARSNKPDLIVLCVELPKMSGYSICNKLKKDAELKGIPLIITSKEATPETFAQHKKLKTRAEDYLIKPFSSDDLLEKIGGLIDMPAGEAPLPEADDDDDALAGLEALDDLAGDAEDALNLGELDDALSGLETTDPDEALLAGLDDGNDLLDANAFDAAGFDDIGDNEGLSGLDDVNLDALEIGDDDGIEEVGTDDVEPMEAVADLEPEAAPKPAPAPAAVAAPSSSAADLEALSKARRENTDLKAKVSELEARLSAAEEQAKSSQAQLNETTSSSSSSARETLELKKAVRAKEKELGDLNDQILAGEEKVVELQEEIDKVRREAQEAINSAGSKDAEIASLSAKVTAITQERDELETQVKDRLAVAERDAASFKSQLEAANADHATKLSALESDLSAQRSATDAAKKEAEESGTQLVEAYNRLKKEERLREKAREAANIALSILSGDVDDSADGNGAAA